MLSADSLSCHKEPGSSCTVCKATVTQQRSSLGASPEEPQWTAVSLRVVPYQNEHIAVSMRLQTAATSGRGRFGEQRQQRVCTPTSVTSGTWNILVHGARSSGGVTQCEKVVTTECARQGANRWAGVVTICLDVQVEGKGMEQSSGEGNLLEARSTEPITRLG